LERRDGTEPVSVANQAAAFDWSYPVSVDGVGLAVKVEADDYVERHRGERDEYGRALVVRNGQAQGRKLTLGTGTVELKAPRVDDRRRDEQGGRQRFTSHILPRYMRRSPKVAEVLPILYLRGLLHRRFSARAAREAPTTSHSVH